MQKYYHLIIAILAISTGLMATESPAQGLLNSAPPRQHQTEPSSTYSIEYITVTTPRHGQGTFTIYRPAGYSDHRSQGTVINPATGENRDHNPVNQVHRRPVQQTEITFYYPGSRGGFGPHVYGHYRPQNYGGYTYNYLNSPSQRFYRQQPVRPFRYYPDYNTGLYRRHGHQADHQQKIEHFNIQQCLGAQCGNKD
jgi:hypothetical protein